MKTPDHIRVPAIGVPHQPYVGPLPSSPDSLSAVFRGIEEGIVRVLDRTGDRDILPTLEPATYSYFRPAWHAKTGLVPHVAIRNLLKPSTKALFVGSGPALLERMLIEDLSVPRENIVISDIHLEEEAKGLDVEQWEFDMFGTWPLSQEKFDYVFFPESFGVAVMHYKGEIEKDAVRKEELKGIEDVLFDIYVQCKDHATATLYRENSILFKMLSLLIKVLDKSLFFLKEGGEIRLGSISVLSDFPEWQGALSKALQHFGFHHVEMKVSGSVVIFKKTGVSSSELSEKHVAPFAA